MTAADDYMFDLSDVKVGDTVLIRSGYKAETANRRREPEPEPAQCVVEKVGRSLLHVRVNDWGKPTPFDREDGIERVGQQHVGNVDRAFTEEGYAFYMRRKLAHQAVQTLTSGHNWIRNLSAAQAEAIAEIMTHDDSVEVSE